MRTLLPTLILCLAVSAPPLQAQSKLPGISFDLMPIGCRIHGAYTDGRQIIDEYLGRRGSMHLMRTMEGPDGRTLIRTTTFNALGFMVRKDWAEGTWETYAPYSCFDEVGDCSYDYRNGHGASKRYSGTVTRRGGYTVSRGGFVGEPPFAESVITPGPFNMGAAFTEGTVRFRVTRYENCSLEPPTS